MNKRKKNKLINIIDNFFILIIGIISFIYVVLVGFFILLVIFPLFMLFPVAIIFKDGYNIKWKIKQYKEEWFWFIKSFERILR